MPTDPTHVERVSQALQTILRTSITVFDALARERGSSLFVEAVGRTRLLEDPLPQDADNWTLWLYSYLGSARAWSGKARLQRLVAARLSDADARALYGPLTAQAFQVWNYHGLKGGKPKANMLFGPKAEKAHAFDAVMTPGASPEASSAMLGFSVDFEGQSILVGLRFLRPESLAALKEVAFYYGSDRNLAGFWERIEPTVIRVVVDHRDDHPFRRGAWPREASTTARSILREVRNELYDGLVQGDQSLFLSIEIARQYTPEQWEAFDELLVLAQTMIKRRHRGTQSVKRASLRLLRELYFCDKRRAAKHLKSLESHPLGLLDVDDATLEGLQIDKLTPIAEALFRAKARPGHLASIALDKAWRAYCIEQRWTAVMGFDAKGKHRAHFGEHDVFSILQALAPPGFHELALGALPVDAPVLRRVLKALGEDGQPAPECVGDLSDDALNFLAGVGELTVARLRQSAIELMYRWRWDRLGLEPSLHRPRTAKPRAVSKLREGLEDLAELFGPDEVSS
ncbi:MAG: hypothetical protein H0U74_22275 [Bradymonadaceae bacterium]|nr:hypothetical protein [Lujinxingiaceae bacterium]